MIKAGTLPTFLWNITKNDRTPLDQRGYVTKIVTGYLQQFQFVEQTF
jgi:hypothetical protein